jgi:hypothetical protein
MVHWLGTLAVLAHAIVALVHGVAHARLGVELSTWQQGYVAVVIVFAPLLAAGMLWTRLARWGCVLLAASMAGSMVFGVYHHYVAVSPDHVSHLPPGDWQGAFRRTALLLAVTESFGLAVGLWGLWRGPATRWGYEKAG